MLFHSKSPCPQKFTERTNHFYPWFLVMITILAVQFLLLLTSWPIFFSLSIKHIQSLTSPTLTSPTTNNISHIDNECVSGKIYVYNLPLKFNIELLQTCHGLDPWHSKCKEVLNYGLGPIATKLAGVVPDSLAPAWHWTDQFTLEIIFHNRLLMHKCRTLEPESATAFYIPFYAGLVLNKYLWYGTPKERDYHPEMLLRWVQDQPSWKRSNGSDHFIALGRITWDFRRWEDKDWGSTFLRMPAMQHVTRLLVERNPWDYGEIGVPYPTGFHPRSDSDIIEWQNYVRTHSRKSLFTFVGATRSWFKNDFRNLLMRHCVEESESCKVVDCSGTNLCATGNSAILEAFLSSDFCLQPRGDSYTRRSVFDCMVAGSIPVFFWSRTAYDQYELFLPSEHESYSVFIDYNEVKNGSTSVKGVLEKFSREDVKKMREKVIDFIPKIVYAKPQEGLETIKDAFDIAIDGVLRRFKQEQVSKGNNTKDESNSTSF